MADGFRVLENGDSRISEAGEFRVTQGYFWDGPRETEASDPRITEADVFRVTEKFLEGLNDLQAVGSLVALQSYKTKGYWDNGAEGYCVSVALRTTLGLGNLNATGSISPDADLKMPVSSNFTGTATIASSATVGKYGFSALTSSGTLDVIPSLTLNGLADLSVLGSHAFAGYDRFIGHTHNFEGFGSVSTSGNIIGYRSSNLNAVGSISPLQALIATGSSAVNATGTLSSSGTRIRYGLANFNGAGSLASIGTPKFYATFNKTGTGSLASDGTKIDFSSTMYYKVGTTWKTTTPYVKRSGTWSTPVAVYKNISGSWKRVY